jgi:hypothetical protein
MSYTGKRKAEIEEVDLKSDLHGIEVLEDSGIRKFGEEPKAPREFRRYTKPGKLFTGAQVKAEQMNGEEEGEEEGEIDKSVFVDRHEHFACPTKDDDCHGCPKTSAGTYQEYANRCMEAARRVICAQSDLKSIQERPRYQNLATHPDVVKASDPRRMGVKETHRPSPGIVVLRVTVEIVDHPLPDGIALKKKHLIRAHNFEFTDVEDPANSSPKRGRKKRPLVKFKHAFDISGGHGIGRHRS